MFTPTLIDLDELVLMCRDEKARGYIAEAVASYRAGAFRSAIVGAWIGVCFDIIDKLKELALSGDKDAELQTEALEKIRASGDVSNALKFERSLLEIARDKFELISHLEFIDLERLQADRNRCAHPSLASEDQAYVPSAELVRAHLHSAVYHLLQHPPVQGKYALERLIREFDSAYFPTDEKKVLEVYAAGPLRKPRDSLVRNFAVVLLKRTFAESPNQNNYKILTVLAVVLKMHRPQVEKLLKERLSKTIRELSDARLYRAIRYFEKLPETWMMIDTDVKTRIDEFVKKLPSDCFVDLEFLLGFEPLKKSAAERVRYASLKDLSEDYFFTIPTEAADRLIAIYLNSKSFDEANDVAKVLKDYVYDLSKNQIVRLVTGAAKNGEITGSFAFDGMMKKIKECKTVRDEIDALLIKVGLGKYVDEF